MSEGPLNVLNETRSYLMRRGEECEWICSATDNQEKIGLAFVQFESSIPCSFLFTWDKDSEVFSLDVIFASKIPEDRHVEMTLIISRLNYTLSKGRFVLDLDGGYILFRQTSCLAGLNLTHEQYQTLITNMEKQGIKMAERYAQLLEDEFSGYC